jgi:PAS domain S-box-containing protein
VAGAPELASFLIARRAAIETALVQRLGPAAPGPGSPESEVLRRFRSYAAAALMRGSADPPALDGLRSSERRAVALLEAWVGAATDLAEVQGERLRAELAPLLARFHGALRQTASGRRARGGAAVRSRRAVMAAIDRVCDAFLALDIEDGRIVDANPAAGSLLGVARDALLGVDALSFVPDAQRDGWWVELDAVSEGAEPRRFATCVRDVRGRELPVECSVTRFATRERTLALVLARPS